MALSFKEQQRIQKNLEKNAYTVDQLIENEDRIPDKIATHDKPLFRSVPATGVRGDQPAGEAWKRLLKPDESLLRTIDRLKAQRTNTGGVTGAEFLIPKEGPGGYGNYPYDDRGDYRGPVIPNPNPGQPFDWAGQNNQMLIAHQTHTDNPVWSGEHKSSDHILYDPSGNPYMIETPDGIVPYTPENVETYL